MEYYSAIERNSFDTNYNIDEPWKHYAKWNKVDTEGQILNDSTCMK